MKTPKLFTTLVILMTLTSFSQARFYIGVDLGYVYTPADINMNSQTIWSTNLDGTQATTFVPGYYIKNATKTYGDLLNFNIGNEYHFDDEDKYGIRWIGSVGYGNANMIDQSDKSITYPSYMLNLGIGIDVLFDLFKFSNQNSLGFFVGLEGEGMVLNSNETEIINDKGDKAPLINALSLLLTPRFGISLLLNNHHRIEIMGKVPVYNYNPSKNEIGEKIYIATPYEVAISYKYIF